MKISDRYPIVVTEHKVACRDFWQKHFGLDVLFDIVIIHLPASNGAVTDRF